MTDCSGCLGCSSFKESKCASTDHQDIAITKCPCSICIVKAMCSSTCMDWTHYWNNWKQHIRKGEYEQNQKDMQRY